MIQAVQTENAESPVAHDRRPAARPAGKRRSKRSSRSRFNPAAQKQACAKASDTSGGFAELGISRPLLAALDVAGFSTPTDIQRELIPPALAGRDCLGQARTGTGKTAAFALPMLELVRCGGGVQALVLVPTRELAAQVGEHVHMLAPHNPPRTLVVYGGTSINANLRELKRGADIVVGTPGRVLDLISRGALNLSGVRLAVLDEVDRMLDIGFRDDIRRIMATVGRERQTIFVSATITPEIRRLAQGLMRNSMEINVSEDRVTVEKIKQDYMSVSSREKFGALCDFLDRNAPRLAIVFTRTKRGASNVSRKLARANVACAEIHGGLAQGRRTRVLNDLRAGRLKVLVATDLASRGLDVSGVSHVVNYDVPVDPAVYVHRIGRTARMGATGHALTLVTPEQGGELTAIERLINRQLDQVEGPASGSRDCGHAGISSSAGTADVETCVVRRDAASCEVARTKRPRVLGDRYRYARRRR